MNGGNTDVGKHHDRLLHYVNDLRNHLPLMEAEVQHIKELQKESDNKQLNSAKEENKHLTQENDDLKRKLKALKTETGQREHQYAKSKVMANKEIERWKRQCEEIGSLVEGRFKKEIDELKVEKCSLEEKCNAQRHQIRILETKVRKLEENEHNRQELPSKTKNVDSQSGGTGKEQEATQLRLTELTGHQLPNKNPSIPNLSDQHRPTKLGEMFSALYDDEYTDAFEEINTGNDKQTCKKLLDLLMDAKRFCDDQAETQLRALKRECLGKDTMSTSTDTSLVDNSLKELKDIRKKYAKKALEGVYDKFVNHMTYTKYSTIFREPRLYAKTIVYAKKCVELCWLMAVQDPPLAFGALPQSRDKFNTDLFREFTKSGTAIDFPVWPVLHLHENGPVLSKGVVEPGWPDNRTEIRSYESIDQDRYSNADYRRHNRDLDVDESSRPISTPDSYNTNRRIDDLFKTYTTRASGYTRGLLTESGLSGRQVEHDQLQEAIDKTYHRLRTTVVLEGILVIDLCGDRYPSYRTR